MTERRKAVMSKAVGVARAIAEGSPDPEDFPRISVALESARQWASGELTVEQIEREFAERMGQTFAEVDRQGSEATWALHLRITEQTLCQLTPAELSAMLERVRWADACNPEPWETGQASPTPDPSIPALSSTETAEQVDPGPEVPPTAADPSDPLWDNSDSDGSTAEDPDVDPVEVIDAEVVEVERVTSSQTTHKLPPGQFYSPSNRPSWERSLKRSRPSIEISTSSAHLDDRR